MKIIKVNDYNELGVTAAEFFLDSIKNIDQPVVGLATGSTPEKLYEILVNKFNHHKISFKQMITFNLDEYVGLAKNDPNSYHYYMYNKFFDFIDIKRGNIHILNGLADNLQDECNSFEHELKQRGKIDLQVLGLGLNGHIGFNEPGTPFDKRSHVVKLTDSTRKINSRFFADHDSVPTHALTMGIKTIMDASEILLLVQGEKKADILKKVIYGKVTESVPASVLQTHSNVTVITDIDL